MRLRKRRMGAPFVAASALLFGVALTALAARAGTDDSAASAGGKVTTITGEILESHDLLPDADGSSAPLISDIRWSHRFTVELSGHNHIEEKWFSVRLGVGPSALAHRKLGGPPQLTKSMENSATIGAGSGKAVWHVLAANKLQRLFAGQHFLMMIDIEIGADKSCRLEAKYVKQVGFTSVVLRRATTGELANFSLPQVQSATCEIQ